MKNLFVSYEIAKQLKDKGFDQGCIAWYDINTKEFNVLGQEGDRFRDRFHLTANVKEIIQSPMYQQIIDWFREKHKISITPWRDLDSKTKWYFEILDERINCVNRSFTSGLSDNYYEALTKAIYEALKLI